MTTTILAQDKYANAIQALAPGVTQNIATASGASAVLTTSLAVPTIVVRVVSTTDCYLAIGPAASVVATTSSMLLPANSIEYFRVAETAGIKVAALAVSAAGILNVTEMA